MKKTLRFIVGLSSLLLAASTVGALAETYPERPIRLIVPDRAGSTQDGLARVVMPVVSKILGQQVVIENEAGAGGIPGAARAAKMAPDGYTLFLGNSTTQAINPHIYNSLPYDPLKGFAAVAGVSNVALIMAVPTTSAATDVKSFVALTKEGKFTKYASLGPGTAAQLAMERLKMIADIKLKQIPFPSGPQPVLALGNNEIDSMFYGYSVLSPVVQAGSIKLIGIATRERSGLLPEIPTMREQGYDVVVSVWYGVFAPAGTPKDITDKLAAAITQAVKDPAVVKILNGMGSDAFPTDSPEAFTKIVEEDYKNYEQTIKEIGIEKK